MVYGFLTYRDLFLGWHTSYFGIKLFHILDKLVVRLAVLELEFLEVIIQVDPIVILQLLYGKSEGVLVDQFSTKISETHMVTPDRLYFILHLLDHGQRCLYHLEFFDKFVKALLRS